MGGHAFQATLGANALFPRMTHATYQRLKTFCVSKLQNYFNYVEVAPEDPEKLDYGDLDVLVFDQKVKDANNTSNQSTLNLVLKEALEAEHMAPGGGPLFSTYALRASPSSNSSEEAEVFHQVDVNIYKTRDAFDLASFYASYGDLGIILSTVFRPFGLGFGKNGLKISSKTYLDQLDNKSFPLSTSVLSILSFINLSPLPSSKFKTRDELFNWILTSNLTQQHASLIYERAPSSLERVVYQAFLRRLQQLASITPDVSTHLEEDTGIEVERALDHFSLRDSFQQTAQSVARRRHLKQHFNGNVVMEVAGIDQKKGGMAIKYVMDDVREHVSEDEIVVMSVEERNRRIGEAAQRVRERHPELFGWIVPL